MSIQPHDRRAAKAKIKTNRQPRRVDVRKLKALEQKYRAISIQFLGFAYPEKYYA